MNDLKLQEGHPVDENLRPIKVGGKATALETAQSGDGSRVNGNLEVTGDIIGNMKDAQIELTRIDSDGDLVIDIDGDLIISAGAAKSTYFYAGAVGFRRQEAGFSDTPIIGSGGTDDTDIDFRKCNKMRLEMTGDIVDVNLIFPAVSGNFLIVCTTDGDHDVARWKVYESDESGATTDQVMWAGGSLPAFTDNGIDIVSFYWDAEEQQAYGVASLAFALP